MSAESDDIKRVLAICFRTGAPQTADDLERILSFDTGWMDTETAYDAIQALTFAGWIKENDGLLSANCDIKSIIAPLGWQPRPSRLTDPVVNEAFQPEKKQTEMPKVQVVKKSNSENTSSTDPRARMQKRLAKFISKQSGIELEEINRRADRKMKALRYCTMWLALCLISREQDLEMGPIIDSFANR